MTSKPLPNDPMKEIQKNAAQEVPNTTAPIAPKNPIAAPLPKKSHHKKQESTTSNLSIVPADPSAVPVEVEAQAAPVKESGGLVGLLKQAKARADINDDPGEEEEVKRSHKKGEGTGRKRGRPSNEDNRDEFSTLVFTILTIVISFANLPPEIRPVENELQSLAYNIAGILARHLPALGNLSPDLVDLMGITGTLAVWYQRAGPELKRIQAEKSEGHAPGEKRVKNPNGHIPQVPVDLGPADPIANVSPGAGDFLTQVHKGGDNGNSEG